MAAGLGAPITPADRSAMHEQLARWNAVEVTCEWIGFLARALGYGTLFACAGGGLDVTQFLVGALLADAATFSLAKFLHWPEGAMASKRDAWMLGIGMAGFGVIEGWPRFPVDPEAKALCFLGFLSVLAAKGVPRLHLAMRR